MTAALHQATCVAVEGRAVLIEGPPESGKSTLALALIERGATLIGDDGVRLERRGKGLFASPPPHTAGLLEVRNVGLLSFATASDVPVALAIVLDPQAPRFIDAAEQAERFGAALPLLRLWPSAYPPASKVELALARYGLT